MIKSEHAAQFLVQWIDQPRLSGPINVASPQPIELRQMVQWIESKTNKRAILMNKPLLDAQSPYGIEKDLYLNTEKLEGLGFKLAKIENWLPALIESECMRVVTPSSHH